MSGKEKKVHQVFLRTKPARMLAILKTGPKYATILSKEVDMTYSHTVKLLELFKEYGLVEFEKKGRIKIVKVTELGGELATAFDSILVKLSKIKEKS